MRLLRNILTKNNYQLIYCSAKRKYATDLFEPDYLEGLKSKVPLYDAVDIKIRCYDYPILENYQKLIHNLANNMNINVEDCWAVPAQNWDISTYKPSTEILESQYKLKIYERVVQVSDMSTLQLPLLIKVIEASLPVGVTVEFSEHTEQDDETRYVPDHDLLTLKQTLEDMGGASKKK